MLEPADFEIAPCLRDGPVAKSGRLFVEAARQLSQTRGASLIRAWCVAHLFQQVEKLFAGTEAPVSGFNATLEGTARLLREMDRIGFVTFGGGPPALSTDPENAAPVEGVTGNHYGQLFRGFSSLSFWTEATDLLRTRLERNGVDLNRLREKSLVDAGCGGGRYTAAWRALGARPAVAVDVSPVSIADANARVGQAGLLDIQFAVADVLRLPFADDRFDIAFSNGVLHHTRDWQEGVAELVRVLRPGGLGWLYLIEKPGGLFWDLIEILRLVMRQEERQVARFALQVLGLPGNRIYYLLDHVMVPINIRLRPEEIEERLTAAGACRIRRLCRGTDFDRAERIYRKEPFAELKYGVGENRYVFSKM